MQNCTSHYTRTQFQSHLEETVDTLHTYDKMYYVCIQDDSDSLTYHPHTSFLLSFRQIVESGHDILSIVEELHAKISAADPQTAVSGIWP